MQSEAKKISWRLLAKNIDVATLRLKLLISMFWQVLATTSISLLPSLHSSPALHSSLVRTRVAHHLLLRQLSENMETMHIINQFAHTPLVDAASTLVDDVEVHLHVHALHKVPKRTLKRSSPSPRGFTMTSGQPQPSLRRAMQRILLPSQLSLLRSILQGFGRREPFDHLIGRVRELRDLPATQLSAIRREYQLELDSFHSQASQTQLPPPPPPGSCPKSLANKSPTIIAVPTDLDLALDPTMDADGKNEISMLSSRSHDPYIPCQDWDALAAILAQATEHAVRESGGAEEAPIFPPPLPTIGSRGTSA